MLNILKSKLLSLSCITFAFVLSLLPFSAMAADNWIEVRSPHFIVNTNAGEKEARKVADQFEQIRRMFQSAFSALRVDPAKPISIVSSHLGISFDVFCL